MRIVVKIGTNVLIGDSQIPRAKKIQAILEDIFNLRKLGIEVILVSSGAIGFGRRNMPSLNYLSSKRVWAAIGQPALMHAYSQKAGQLGMQVAQCLVLKDDFTDRQRYENFVNTVEGLLFAGVLPVINENDVVAMSDLTVGDNDLLAAMVAVAADAHRLVILTNQSGLFTANPDNNPEAKLVKTVNDVDAALERMVSAQTSELGRGGMLSKIRAAKHATHAGVETVIADGRADGVLVDLFLKNQSPGTVFKALSPQTAWTKQKRWLLASKGIGQIVIDEGAVNALAHGKSLFLPGIAWVRGMFSRGEVVEIITKNGRGVAYGRVNYSSKQIQLALDKQRRLRLNLNLEKEVIHRDHMAVLSGVKL